MKDHTPSPALCDSQLSGDCLCIKLAGRLDHSTIPELWARIRDQIDRKGIASILLNAEDIQYCDGAGIALLKYIRLRGSRQKLPVEFEGVSDELARLITLYNAELPGLVTPPRKSARQFVEDIGEAFAVTLSGLKDHIAFLGELSAGLIKVMIRPAGLRMKDFMRVAEESGAQALPIIGMLGFLVGLILAFQGAVLMKQFAAEIFIADFVGKSVARELGPLITAIIVAGRTGSAFAAEIGTMKVNEEIDALATMGLDPVRFLVIPRVLAATLMTPLLAVLTNVFAMAGGSIVMSGLGFPLITYVNRLLEAVTLSDYVGGLLKAVVFGALIAASGCLCGLRTGEGASAVGNSATRAVVSAIIMIVIADGIFAVLFYLLGI